MEGPGLREKKLARIIVGVKRAEKRIIDEIRVEIDVKERVKKKLVRSTRAGRVERMGDAKLAKRADTQTAEGKWRRG